VPVAWAARALLGLACGLTLAACDFAYPEVALRNDLGEGVWLRAASYSGCAWSEVLAPGAVSAPERCLPGESRVHFELLRVPADCAALATEPGGQEACADAPPPAPGDPPRDVGTWFPYKTVWQETVDYGDFRVLELRGDAVEQDFSAPGPYGH